MKPEETIEKTLLSNGVRILSQRMPHVQSVSMGVWVNIGSRDETDAENGLSHFIEHMIFKGTQKRSAFEIAKAFDAIGGYSNAFTSMENTCYHAKVMGNHLETMSEILTDIFLNSLFDEAEIEKERPVIFQEIGMLEDTPDEYVHQLAARSFWGEVLWEDRSWAPATIFSNLIPKPFAVFLSGSISRTGLCLRPLETSNTTIWLIWPVRHLKPFNPEIRFRTAAFRMATSMQARKYTCTQKILSRFISASMRGACPRQIRGAMSRP